MGLGNKQKVQEIHWEPELTTALKNVFQIVPELHFNALDNAVAVERVPHIRMFLGRAQHSFHCGCVR